jgi:polyvinyl alcohol dehydrogenase (cytochrome)
MGNHSDRGGDSQQTLHCPVLLRRSPLLAVGALAVFSLLVVMTANTAFTASASNDATTSWTVYHGDPAGSGVSSQTATVNTSSEAWTSAALDGQLYGEPLISSTDIFVATENDTVYALSASTGSIIWSTHTGVPVPASSLPCGDISPTVGITGTPVIDPSRNEIFVVADELVNGSPVHTLVGLNVTSGKTEMSEDVDPPGSDPAALLQRTGLTLDAGQVVFAMGGNYGDCSSYRGRVGEVSEGGGTPAFFTVDAAAGDSQGAIWMGGAAPAVDANGNIWVGVGNGSVNSTSQPYDDSDSVLELSSSLKLLQYFAPSSWASDNEHDLDMSTEPALLPDGQVIEAGKSRIVYLLNGADLGGIGKEQASLESGCNEDIDGGTAVVGMTVYLPCLSGIIAVQATQSPPSLRILWNAKIGSGPPIVAGGLVWSIGQNGTLYGLDPATGQVRQQASIGSPATHFPTAAVGEGLLIAPTSNRVIAFSVSSPTTSTSSTAQTHPTTTSTPGTSRTAPARNSDVVLYIALAVGALAIVSGSAWVVRRKRTRRSN